MEITLFNSILNLIPTSVECKMQTDDNCIIGIINNMENSHVDKNGYSCNFLLTKDNKTILLNAILTNKLKEEYIHYFEIRDNKTIIFVAYDGFEISEISANIPLSTDFINTYVKTGLCIVKDEIKIGR